MSEEQDRATLEQVWCERWGGRPGIERLAAGLGQRRFYRLRRPPGDSTGPTTRSGAQDAPGNPPETLIARFEAEPSSPSESAGAASPPAWLPEPPLEPLRSFLERAGLPVPASFLHDPERGLDLLEDVGHRTLLDVVDPDRLHLYREACRLIPRLQSLDATPEAIPAFGRVYDRALVRTKAWKWLHWAVPGLLGRPPTPDERAQVEGGFERIADDLADAPRRLSHRDFKAENLHLVGDTATGPKLVMIDVQGAFLAPPEYDLVCLLNDVQTDLDEALTSTLIEETLVSLPDPCPPEQARRRFDALALMRLCKDVSHIVDAALNRGDRRRWHEIPRGLALIDRAAQRLTNSFPEIRELTCVIHALTQAARSADAESRGCSR
jgi:aminoglycoside/choline kinase family phosphotransferase